MPIRVTIWNEFRHEKRNPKVAEIYPDGIHMAIAKYLGKDPIDFRLKNAAKEGTRRADGPKYRRIGCVEVIEAMKNHPHYRSPIEGPNRGRGVAIGFWFNIGLPSSCTISVNADGTVNLVEGSTDIGGTRTSIAMQAAEVLGIPSEAVRPTVVDTDSVGFTAVTGGSRRATLRLWESLPAKDLLDFRPEFLDQIREARQNDLPIAVSHPITQRGIAGRKPGSSNHAASVIRTQRGCG